MAEEQQTLVGSDALGKTLENLKGQMPQLASESDVRKIVTDYGKAE